MYRFRILLHTVLILGLLLGAIPLRAVAAPPSPSAALAQAQTAWQAQSARLRMEQGTTERGRAGQAPMVAPLPAALPAPPVAPESPATTGPTPASSQDAEETTDTKQAIHPASASLHRVLLPLVQHAVAPPTSPANLSAGGGEISSPEGSIVLNAPAGAVTEDTWVTLTISAQHPPVAATRDIGIFFELTAQTATGQQVTHFAKPLTLLVRYTPATLAAGATRGVFFHDPAHDTWLPLPTTDDGSGLLSATTDHFTQFAALVTPLSGCNPAPGQAVPPLPLSIEQQFLAAFAAVDGESAIGCPTGYVQDWEGAWTQEFANGGAIIYNQYANPSGQAFYVGPGYIDAYRASGGPDDFLGLPTQHSTLGSMPDRYFQDFGSDFTGTPIQQFQYGFVGWNQRTLAWEGSRYYPLVCNLVVSVAEVPVEIPPVGNPDPDADPIIIIKHQVAFTISGIVDPGKPDNGSTFNTITLRLTDQATGVVTFYTMTKQGDQFVYLIPDLFDPTQILSVAASAERAIDLRYGFAPQTWYVDGNEYSIPANPTTGTQLASCNGAALPGGGGYTPPADTIAPVVSDVVLYQDGLGNISIKAKATDNRAVARVTLTLDGRDYVMLPRGNDMYEAAIYGLTLGVHSFTIIAYDTSGNPSLPVSGTFKTQVSSLYGQVDWQAYSPDPVNTRIGNYIYKYTDLKLPEPGPDILIERFYNGQSMVSGVLVLGWTTMLDMHVTEVDNALLQGAQLRYADGRTVNFPASGTGFGHAKTTFDTLERAGSGYKLTCTDQISYLFDDKGRLVGVEDHNGNHLAVSWTNDLPLQLVSSTGRTLTFTSNGKQITEIKTSNLTLIYTYDTDGRLQTFSDGNGVPVTYCYDPVNGLTSLQTPQGHNFVQEQQFDPQGRVIYQRVGDNFKNWFSYDDANRTTTLTDTYQNTITYRYDDKNRLIEQIDAFGNSERWTYNDDNQHTSYTDRNSNTTFYKHDAQGNLIETIDPLTNVTSYVYDSQHHVLIETDALNRTTSYQYDPQGNRIAIINALRETITMVYNARGQLIEKISPRGFHTTFDYDPQGNLAKMTDPLGGVTRYEYDQQGRQTRQIDANGHSVHSTFDANSNLLTETDALGNSKTYIYDHNNNRISETDANGNTTTYSYNGLDNLVATAYPDGGKATITYDDLNHRIAESDPLGNTTRWTLDKTYRVIAESDPLGNTTSYTYDAHGNRTAVIDPRGFVTSYAYDKLHRTTIITDALGGVTHYTYDKVGNRISETNPNGATTTYAYDELNRVTAETNALGFTTRYAYDADGNRTHVTDALGFVSETAYDRMNRRIVITDALGFSTHLAYDSVGNQELEIDALGHTSRVEYDPLNRVAVRTDALGHTTHYQYDRAGNTIAEMDALGHLTRYSYDSRNRRVAVTDALGGQTRTEYDLAGRRVSATDANGNVTRTKYDAAGRTIAVIDPLGFTERYAYDPSGNQVAVVDKNGHTTRVEYDALGRAVARTDGLGFVTRFVYDAVGNVRARIDANGNTTAYGYDALNRQVMEQNALGFITRSEHDRLGRVIRVTFPDGTSINKLYDALGRLIAEQDAEGFSKTYGFDGLGNQTVMTDTLGIATQTTYDALRRPIEVRDSLGTIKQTEYNAVGNVISMTDGNGNIVRMEYDALRRTTVQTDAAGHASRTEYDLAGNVVAITNGNGYITHRSYDARNQLVTETDPLGNTMRYAYDGAGQRAAEIDPLGVVTRSVYDAAGRLVAVILNERPGAPADAETNITTSYTYDAVGNRLSISDPNGHTTSFTPDALGQLVAESDPLGNTTRYIFDQQGRQVERQNPNGTIVRSVYDRNGRLVRTAYPDGSSVLRTYDGNGNLLTIDDPTGVTRYAYDARNRPLSEETARGMVRYTYDNANNRTSITYADGKTARYTYDANSRIERVTNPDGAVTAYARDGAGQVIRQENGNGTITTQQYDAASRLEQAETHRAADNRLISRADYVYNAAGQRTSATITTRSDQERTLAEHYSYDALRRLTGVSASNGAQTSYRYDAAGNRLAWQTSDDPATSTSGDRLDMAYSYDPADQLVRAEDKVDQTHTDYRYDANGNRTEQRGPRNGMAYSYDAENRIVAVSRFDVSNGKVNNTEDVAAMAYDGHGRRVAKSEVQNSSTHTTAYLYDGLDALASYETWHGEHANLYRAENGRILAHERSGGQEAWYAQDALGSSIALSDDNGGAVHAYRYDAYGTISGSFGAYATATAFTFTGQEYDATIGLYHFHARAYDPATATWLSRDPFRGTPGDPQSLHRYGYVKGNPVNLWDVYGFAACGSYGKCKNEVDPLFKLLFDITRGREVEFDSQDWLGKKLKGISLPDAISDIIQKQTPVKFDFTLGYSVEDSKEYDVINLSVKRCKAIEPYFKLSVEGEWPIAEATLFSLSAGIGGEVGVKGSLKGCIETDANVESIDLSRAVSIEASIIAFGQLRGFIRGESRIPFVEAELEAGIRGNIEYPLLECSAKAELSVRGHVNINAGCPDEVDIDLNAEFYASAKLDFMKQDTAIFYRFAEFQFKQPSLIGWLKRLRSGVGSGGGSW